MDSVQAGEANSVTARMIENILASIVIILLEIADRELLTRIRRLRHQRGIINEATYLPYILVRTRGIKKFIVELLMMGRTAFTTRTVLQRAFKEARLKAGVFKPAGPHTLRD